MMKSLMVVILASTYLVACAAAERRIVNFDKALHSTDFRGNDSIGRGPITLSADVQAELAQYLSKPNPQYFAVSLNGTSSSFTYCEEGSCQASDEASTIAQCEQANAGTPCKIYAANREVVWQP